MIQVNKSHLQSEQQQLRSDIIQFQKFIKVWRKNNLDYKASHTLKQILVQYIIFLEEYHNFDSLQGFLLIKKVQYKEELSKITSQKQLFLSRDLFEKGDWSLNFSKRITKKLENLTQKTLFDFFLQLRIMKLGFLNFTREYDNYYLQNYNYQSKRGLKYYKSRLNYSDKKQILLISIGVRRVPYYNFNEQGLQGFNYIETITCQDIFVNLNLQNYKAIDQIIEKIQIDYQVDPRLLFSKNQLILENSKIQITKYSKELLTKQPKKYQRLDLGPISKKIQKQSVLEDFNFHLANYKQHRLIFDYLDYQNQGYTMDYQYFSEDELEQNRIKNLQIQMEKNKKITFKDYKIILQNLQSIPNFRYKLTHQQRGVLCSNGNLIVIGRSGTGKTTCAMIRLYGIEFSVKIRQANFLQRQVIQKSQMCKMRLLQEIFIAKNIFLTFSSYLIDEIENQYNDMIYQIKKQHGKICKKNCKIGQNTEVKQNIEKEEDPFDKLNRIKEEQQRKIVSLSSFNIKSFPAFFSIQNFIKIIDKTLSRPFYASTKLLNLKNHYEIIQAEINKYVYSSTQIVKKDTIKATYVDFSFFVNFIWDQFPKQFSKQLSQQYCLLKPQIVWSEMFSILKGSLNSYRYPDGIISLKMYIQTSQSIFHNQLKEKMIWYKSRVYKIMKCYIEICKKQNYFDLMDIVTHSLRQISIYGFQIPKINYMFIDQVQDLTASTTLLISKTVANNIFYCGDTAQAITKGVLFRFEDLKLLFNKRYCKDAINLPPPQNIKNLTVNFRSHHFILQLANSIINLLQVLFPKGIDKLRRQKSDLFGPKPFLIINQDQNIIMDLIYNQATHIYDSKQKQNESQGCSQNKRVLNSEQVIIVRNKSLISSLPKNLQNGLIFTPENIKGLQYDEIILYNFFSSSPIFQKWNELLQHLESFQIFQKQQQFEELLNCRNFQQKSEYLDLKSSQEKKSFSIDAKTKKILGYDEEKKLYKLWEIKAKPSLKKLTIELFHQLQTQIKILYTAITRARSVIVIFDSKIPRYLQKLWNEMELFHFVTPQNVIEYNCSINQYVNKVEKHFKSFKFYQKWLEKGNQMLARKDHQNAKKCFINIRKYDLVQRIQALQMEIKADKLNYGIQKQHDQLSRIGYNEKKIVKIRIQRQIQEMFTLYQSIIYINQKYQRFIEVAETYFKMAIFNIGNYKSEKQSKINYERALKYYRKKYSIDYSNKIAICCIELQLYEEALIEYQKLDDVKGKINCYINLEKWQTLINELIANPQQIDNFRQQKRIQITQVKKVISKTVSNIKQSITRQQYVPDNKQNQHLFSFQSQLLQIRKIYFSLQSQKSTNLLKKYSQEKITLSKRILYFKKELTLIAKSKTALQTTFIQISKLKLKSSKILDQKKQQLLSNNILVQKQDGRNLNKLILEDIREQPFIIQNKCNNRSENQSMLQLQRSLLSQQIIDQNSNLSLPKKIQQQIDQQLKMNNLIEQEIKRVGKQIIINHQRKKQISQKYDNFQSQMSILQNNINLLQIQKSDAVKQIQNSTKSIRILKEKQKQMISTKRMNDKLTDYNEKIKRLKSIFYIFKNRILLRKQSYWHGYNYLKDNAEIKNKLNYLKSQQKFMILDKCEQLEEYYACIYICIHENWAHYLEYKYIFRLIIKQSKIYSGRKFVKEQISQQSMRKHMFDIPEPIEKQMQKILVIKKLIGYLNGNYYSSTTSREIIRGINYEEKMMSLFIFQLILQGHYEQVLPFCQFKEAFAICSLFSSNKNIISKMNQLVNKFKADYRKDNQIKFTKNQEKQFLQLAEVINMQRLFFMINYCRSQPFLSKKIKMKDIKLNKKIIQTISSSLPPKIDQIKQRKKIIEKLNLQIEQKKELMKAITQNGLQNYLARQEDIIDEQRRRLFKQVVKSNECLSAALISSQMKAQYQKTIQLSKNTDQYYKLKKNYQMKIKKQKSAYKIFARQQEQLSIQSKGIEVKQQFVRSIKQLRDAGVLRETVRGQIFHRKKQIELFRKQMMIDFNNDRQLQKYIFEKQIQKQKLIERNRQLLDLIKMELKQFINNKYANYFLHDYVYNHFSKAQYQSNYQFCDRYYRLLCDATNISNILKDEPNSVHLCNLVMMYFAYLFDLQFRKDFDIFIIFLAEKCQSQLKQLDVVNKWKIYNKKTKQESNRDLQNTIKNLFVQDKLSLQGQNAAKRVWQWNKMKSEKKYFTYHPIYILNLFLQTIFKAINTHTLPKSHIAQIVFGLYQCRVVSNSQILNFLEHKYVLVSRKSKITEYLKGSNFAYYFDEKDENILCQFDTVQDIILRLVGQQHAVLIKSLQSSVLFKMDQINQQHLRKFLCDFKQPIIQLPLKQDQNSDILWKDFCKGKIADRIHKNIKNLLKSYLGKNNFIELLQFAIFQLREYSSLLKVHQQIKNCHLQLIKALWQKLMRLQQEQKNFYIQLKNQQI